MSRWCYATQPMGEAHGCRCLFILDGGNPWVCFVVLTQWWKPTSVYGMDVIWDEMTWCDDIYHVISWVWLHKWICYVSDEMQWHDVHDMHMDVIVLYCSYWYCYRIANVVVVIIFMLLSICVFVGWYLRIYLWHTAFLGETSWGLGLQTPRGQ